MRCEAADSSAAPRVVIAIGASGLEPGHWTESARVDTVGMVAFSLELLFTSWLPSNKLSTRRSGFGGATPSLMASTCDSVVGTSRLTVWLLFS